MNDAQTTEPEADRTAVISRRMAVPARYLFAAHSKAAHISRWFGPVGYPVTKCDYDFRVGGQWRMVMTGPDGADGPPFGGTFLEIVPNRRIVYSNGFEDGKGGAMDLSHAGAKMILTTIFEEDEGITTVTVSILFATIAMKEEFLGIGMLEGLGSGLDQWEVVARSLAT
jgi:uncharacterized protein YndB with AHSA1/START domain